MIVSGEVGQSFDRVAGTADARVGSVGSWDVSKIVVGVPWANNSFFEAVVDAIVDAAPDGTGSLAYFDEDMVVVTAYT